MTLSNQQLKEYIDCSQDAVAIRWLNKRGVAWWTDSKGKPCTTMEAINDVLLQKSGETIVDLI